MSTVAAPGRTGSVILDLTGFDGALFDMDGVVTDTVPVHLRAWRAVLSEYVRSRRLAGGPLTDADYLRYIDGRHRDDGVVAFLASRGAELPHGRPSDRPDEETVWGLANRKDEAFHRALARHGVRVFPSTVRLARLLRDRGRGVALVSASRNTRAILSSAGIDDLFPVVVDGCVAARLGLPGKPSPATFLEAAEQLRTIPPRDVLVEDSSAGVAAGRTGGFGLVIGIARRLNNHELLAAGAHVVVGDLADVRVLPDVSPPSAGVEPC